MSAAEGHMGSAFLFSDIQKCLLRALQDAEKDNNFIYHAKIPEVSSLTAIPKAAVAKSTPLSSPMSSQFKGYILQLLDLSYFSMLSTVLFYHFYLSVQCWYCVETIIHITRPFYHPVGT